MKEHWKTFETKTPGYCLVKSSDSGQIIGMIRPNDKIWFVGDRVFVIGDHMGYICPEIMKAGLAKIVEIREDEAEHYLGVEMDTGEFGYIKPTRIL